MDDFDGGSDFSDGEVERLNRKERLRSYIYDARIAIHHLDNPKTAIVMILEVLEILAADV